MCARDMPMSKNTEREKFKAITLDKWAAEASKNKQQVVIEDKSDLVEAFHSIAERHEDLKGKQMIMEEVAIPLKKVFTAANSQINNLQRTTAALAYLNSEKVRSQIWVVPAGQGKSKIHAALTYIFLDNTNYDVHVVFQHEGLLEIDRERNKKLQIYCDNSGMRYS